MSRLARDPLFRFADELWDDDAPVPKPITLSGRATFYALFLRSQGYGPEQAARLVVERYPRTRPQLAKFLHERESPINASHTKPGLRD